MVQGVPKYNLCFQDIPSTYSNLLGIYRKTEAISDFVIPMNY